MAKDIWLTPEEVIERKQRKKLLVKGFIFLGTILASALLTIIANQL
ncbi:hypothetical protein [Neobacillus dielmonensis]|nr:hypothetical protein [Neobacillus dielmonensis]